MRLKKSIAFVLLLIAGGVIFNSCKKNTGIIFKIFNLGYKAYTPLEKKSEFVYEGLLGEYLVANERALLINRIDNETYRIRFLPSFLSEDTKELTGFITTLNNRKYLNLYTDDSNYLLFRIDTLGDSISIKLLTHQITNYTKDVDLKSWLKKDGNIPDSSVALLQLPSVKMKEGAAEDWSKNQLRLQVRDIEGYYRFEKIFPDDHNLEELKKMAIEKTVNRANKVSVLYQLMQKYPESKNEVIERARTVCTTTQNCLDFISYFPEIAVKDSVTDKAFRYARTETDYRILMEKFPDHKKTPVIMSKLYYEEKSKCLNENELGALKIKYSNNAAFIRTMNAIREFEKISFAEVQFNKYSYLLSKNSKEIIDRALLFISETNREKQKLTDVFVIVNCNLVDAKEPHSGLINFKQSLNRSLSLKKFISSNPPKNVVFHFIPCGSGGINDSLTDGSVKFILSAKAAEEYKSRFLKLCFSHKRKIIVPDVNREYVADTYVREEELENYLCTRLVAKLKADKKSDIKILPANFWEEEYGKELPEFEEVRMVIINSFYAEKKLRRKNPGDYVLDVK
ncbi:MAG: hypothetical protein IAF38_16810 [Bacteroidia bacterium]|nr:hypothetical protein [Bacteroidia bacterium]